MVSRKISHMYLAEAVTSKLQFVGLYCWLMLSDLALEEVVPVLTVDPAPENHNADNLLSHDASVKFTPYLCYTCRNLYSVH